MFQYLTHSRPCRRCAREFRRGQQRQVTEPNAETRKHNLEHACADHPSSPQFQGNESLQKIVATAR